MKKTVEQPKSVVVEETVYECDRCGDHIPESESDRVWMNLLINTTSLDVNKRKVIFSGRERDSEQEMLCDSCSGGKARSDAKTMWERRTERRESFASMVSGGINIGVSLAWAAFTFFATGFSMSIWNESGPAYQSIVDGPAVAASAGLGGGVAAFVGIIIGAILLESTRFLLARYFDIDFDYPKA